MPLSTRQRAVAAAVLGCLSVLVAPGARAEAAPPPVSLAVESGGVGSPAYRIAVRNDTNQPVATTVRQELPRGTPPTAVSGGGRVSPSSSGGQAAGTEVTWQLQLPARGQAMLSTTLAAAPPGSAVTAPACAFMGGGNQAYDCATATWVGAAAPVEAGPPLWQRPEVVGAAAAALLVLIAVGLWWRRMRRRYAQVRRPVVPATGGPPGMYRSGLAQWGVRRRDPPPWLVVGLAAVLLAGTLAGAGWIGATRVTAIQPNAQSTSGAWVGQGAAGKLGSTLREAAFEFTVYRLACQPGRASAARQCLATVGVRNLANTEQPWYGGLQRAYLPSGSWVSADEGATRAANNGRDLFADPIPAGERRLVALAFTVPGGTPPARIELRSAVFSAGVSVVP